MWGRASEEEDDRGKRRGGKGRTKRAGSQNGISSWEKGSPDRWLERFRVGGGVRSAGRGYRY